MLEDLTNGQLETIQKYLEVLYNPNSDLPQQYPDIIKRRRVVAAKYLSGFRLEQIDSILAFEDVLLIDMLIEVLKKYHNMEYAAMVAQEHQVYALTKAMFEPLDGLDADKKMKAIETQAKISSLLPEAIQRHKGYKKIVYSGIQDEEQKTITKRTVESYAAQGSKKTDD